MLAIGDGPPLCIGGVEHLRLIDHLVDHGITDPALLRQLHAEQTRHADRVDHTVSGVGGAITVRCVIAPQPEGVCHRAVMAGSLRKVDRQGLDGRKHLAVPGDQVILPQEDQFVNPAPRNRITGVRRVVPQGLKIRGTLDQGPRLGFGLLQVECPIREKVVLRREKAQGSQAIATGALVVVVIVHPLREDLLRLRAAVRSGGGVGPHRAQGQGDHILHPGAPPDQFQFRRSLRLRVGNRRGQPPPRIDSEQDRGSSRSTCAQDQVVRLEDPARRRPRIDLSHLDLPTVDRSIAPAVGGVVVDPPPHSGRPQVPGRGQAARNGFPRRQIRWRRH